MLVALEETLLAGSVVRGKIDFTYPPVVGTKTVWLFRTAKDFNLLNLKVSNGSSGKLNIYCGDALTSGNHLIRRIESACGEKRDRNRWNVYCHVPLRLFHLRTAIELVHAFIRQNVHPLTAATFGDWLSPPGQVQYHKFRTITIGLDVCNC